DGAELPARPARTVDGPLSVGGGRAAAAISGRSGTGTVAEGGGAELMSERWAVCLDRDGIEALGRLRRIPGLELCEPGERLWGRAGAGEESPRRRLLSLPGARLFSVLADEQLVAHGATVPSGYLPVGDWQSLARWLSVTLEPAALPGMVPEPLLIRLVP